MARLKKEVKDGALEALRAGKSAKQVSDEFGIAESTVRGWVKLLAPSGNDALPPDPPRTEAPPIAPPDPAPARQADPEGLQAALEAIGEAPPAQGAPAPIQSLSAASAAPPTPTPAGAAAAARIRADQEEYCVRAIEDIKGTVLEVAAMRYGSYLDPASARIQKLGKLSTLGRKSVQRNAPRLAPKLEKLVDGPWALAALIGLETIAMWMGLKREAVKAGWTPPPKGAAPGPPALGPSGNGRMEVKPEVNQMTSKESFSGHPPIPEPFPRAVMS